MELSGEISLSTTENEIEVTECRACGRSCIKIIGNNKYSMYVCCGEELTSVGEAFEQVHGVQLADEDCLCAQCLQRLLDVVTWQNHVARTRERKMAKVVLDEATSAVGAPSTDEAPTVDVASVAGGASPAAEAISAVGAPSTDEAPTVEVASAAGEAPPAAEASPA